MKAVTVATKKRAPKLTPVQKVKLLTETLLELQSARYHFPNSDLYEYCNGCGRSPHNVPDHDEGCLVVKVSRVLDKVLAGIKCIHCGKSVTAHQSWCTKSMRDRVGQPPQKKTG